ncbi:MAG: chemotaxis protein CheA [bacterium]|nr:chemotaxis protein CheA [bacterium]
MSAREEIIKHVGDLSLLSIMVDASDKMGVEALSDIISTIATLCQNDETLDRLARSAQFCLELRSSSGDAEFCQQVGAFASATQNFFNDMTGVKLPGEDVTDDNNDLGEFFDPEFLAEFIEKHSICLDELEGTILDFRDLSEELDESDIEKLHKGVRSYLHNLKGDAGAIGLAGIEKATHVLEDLLLEQMSHQRLEELIAYKEWVGSCIKSYSANETIKEKSEQFIIRLTQMFSSDRLSPAPIATADPIIEGISDIFVEEEPKIELSGHGTSHGNAGSSYAPSADSELFAEFCAEAIDHLDNVESLLLEAAGSFTGEQIDTIFRGVHSLKGASGFFSLLEINETAHILENILDEVRTGKRELDPALTQLVFQFIDLQKKLIERARKAIETGQEIVRQADVVDYIARLLAYASGKPVTAPTSPQKQSSSKTTELTDPEHPQPEKSTIQHEEPAVKKSQTKPTGLENLEIKSYVKVDTSRLDSLIDSIGEMLIYSSMLIGACREHLNDNESVIRVTHQVEKFSRDLQEIGMSMRLDPIKSLFQKMSRLVWDVSKKLNKDIVFKMHGEDTEMDRNVIEKLADPLMHMVRNSLDHGIESAEERLAAGKPAKGTIGLTAMHAGGSIHILIEDDGRGLNPEKLRAKAIEKGIISENQQLTLNETFHLIFAPGFSTAAVVTDISGRGVGMDVVRNNIESMRGQVRIESEPGRGSKFTIELPLTLAIIDGIETTVGRERFIIPTLSILEFMKPTPDVISNTVGHGDTFSFRGRFLPLFKVSELYNVPEARTDICDSTIVVVENAGEQVALLVDALVGSCQTVIKNLGTMFEEGKGIAGCAIMPNGDIGLILDVRSLINLARREVVPLMNLSDSGYKDEFFRLED